MRNRLKFRAYLKNVALCCPYIFKYGAFASGYPFVVSLFLSYLTKQIFMMLFFIILELESPFTWIIQKKVTVHSKKVSHIWLWNEICLSVSRLIDLRMLNISELLSVILDFMNMDFFLFIVYYFLINMRCLYEKNSWFRFSVYFNFIYSYIYCFVLVHFHLFIAKKLQFRVTDFYL